MQDTNFIEEIEFVPIKLRELIIKILPKYWQKDIQGLYNIPTGEIKIGTHEETTVPVIFHETMHKLLFEGMDFSQELDYTAGFKAAVQWDNIAKELEKWLFDDIDYPDLNYLGSTIKVRK